MSQVTTSAPQQSTRFSPRGLFYGWYIVAAGALVNTLVLGITAYGFGTFYEPMRQELGWSMAALAAGVSVRSVETGFLSPFTGFLVDRLGPRSMALGGAVVLALGLLLLGQVHEIWVYYLASMAIALGQSLGGFTAYSTTVMRWFQQKRGRALGLVAFGNGMGYVMVPLIALLMTVVGWRSTALIAGVVVLVLVTPLSLVLRSNPERYGYLPDGERLDPATAAKESTPGAGAQASRSASGMSVAEAVRTPAFLLLVLANAVAGSSASTFVALQVPHLQTAGFSVQTAALLVGMFGLSQAVLRPASGWLGDLFGRRRLLILSYVLAGIGYLCFANVRSDQLWVLGLFYLFFGVGQASWLVMNQTVIADYFGTRRFATLRGLSQMLSLPVTVAMPALAGWLFDTTGSYQFVFSLCAVMTMTGAIWQLLIRRPSWSVIEQDRRAPALAGSQP